MKRRLTDAQKRTVAAAYGWKCAVCNKPLPAAYQVDHIIPLWDGGEDEPWQCQPLCPDDHAAKTQREAIERAQRKRRLKQAAQQAIQKRRRPPLECCGCGHVVSPYFSHACPQ